MPLLPVPLPEELISSVIARGARESGLTCKRQTQDVYGDNRSYHSFLFSDSLGRLAMLSGQTAHRLLSDHTVFPYATAYLGSQVREELASLALSNAARGRLNFVSARVSTGATYRRVCSRCISDDLKSFGTSYWRVSHQLPLASHCLTHDKPLEFSDIPLHKNGHCRDIKLPHESATLGAALAIDIVIAKDLNLRSIHVLKGQTEHQWQAATYRNAAVKLGFVRHSGTLAARALCNEFQSFYGPEYLASVGCSVPDRSLWPGFLCSEAKHTEASTTKHILLATFLSRYKQSSYHKPLHYKPRAKRTLDYTLLDAKLSERLVSKFGDHLLLNAELQVCEVLTQLDAKSLYRHHRAQLPLTTKWIELLKSKKLKALPRSSCSPAKDALKSSSSLNVDTDEK